MHPGPSSATVSRSACFPTDPIPPAPPVGPGHATSAAGVVRYDEAVCERFLEHIRQRDQPNGSCFMNSTAGAHLVSGEERPKSTTGTRRGRALEWLWHRLSRMPADVALIVAASLICEQTHDYFVLALIALLPD